MNIIFVIRLLLLALIGGLGVPQVMAADVSAPSGGSAEIVALLTTLYVTIRDVIVWWRKFRQGR